MNQNRKKRILSLLTALLLCVAMAVPALADQTLLEIHQDDYHSYIVDSDMSGNGWSYKLNSNTLTMNNFKGESMMAGLGGGWINKLNIILSGESVNELTTGGFYGSIFNDSEKDSLTLTFKGTGSLILWNNSEEKAVLYRISSNEASIAKYKQQLAKYELELANLPTPTSTPTPTLTPTPTPKPTGNPQIRDGKTIKDYGFKESSSTMSVESRTDNKSIQSDERTVLSQKIDDLNKKIESANSIISEAQAELQRLSVEPTESSAPVLYWQCRSEEVKSIKLVLEGSLVMTGGTKKGDHQPLTFSQTKFAYSYEPDRFIDGYCAVTPDGTPASYVVIAPAGSEPTMTEQLPATVPISADLSTPDLNLPTRFSDVPDGAYYVDAVKWAVSNGVTNGTSDTTFSPADTCTRGQVATFLWRAKGSPEPSGTANPFVDVDASSPFYKAILWAYENNITAGTSANTFSPGNPCTRAHVVTFLWRAQGQPSATGTSALAQSFPQSYYTDAVSWADGLNILSGVGAGFDPNALCPRSDIVTYLYRALT